MKPNQLTEAWQCFPVQPMIHVSYKKLIQYIFKYFTQDIIFAFALYLIIAILPIVIAIFCSHLFANLDDLMLGHPAWVFLAWLLLFAAFFILSYLKELKVNTLNLKFLYFILLGIWSKILNLPIKTIHQVNAGAVSQKLFDCEWHLSSLLTHSFSLLLNGVSLIVLLIFLGYFSPLLAGIYLLLSFCILGTKILLFPKQLEYIHKKLALTSESTGLLYEALLQIYKIRTSHAVESVFQQWFEKINMLKYYEKKSLLCEIRIFFFESLLPGLLFLLLYVAFYCFYVEITLSTLFIFILVCGQFSALLEKFSLDLYAIIHCLPSFKQMQRLLDHAEEAPRINPGLFQFQGHVSLSDISLKTEDGKKKILDNISLDMPAKKFIALVGPSGAGKSTIFRLILGLQAPDAGNILFDNEHINHINMHFVRKHFGVVLQTTQLFPGTIFSNIAADTQLTLDQAWLFASYVGLDEEIRHMPMQMFTYVSDNTSESLSGGQRQKILIARALAAKPTVLLLDEATSALDNTSQAIVYNSLKQLNMTRLVIAHRHSTIKAADKIYVIENGKVRAQGCYRQLIF